MKGRYLAVVATEPDRAISPQVREAVAMDPSLSVVFDAGGLMIAATETLTCLRLSGERGMIIGPIHRGGVSENGDVAQELAHLFCDEARPELLTQSFWGDYVAFLSDPQSGAWQVLRAPFGRLACLHARLSPSVFVASDVATLRSAGLPKPAINCEALVTRLAYPDHPSSNTCLVGIAALRGGCALRVARGDIAERGVWSPWPFARHQSALANENDAENHVRSAVLRAMRACRGDAGDPLLLLSGGLDSSVLAASLAALGGGFACVNFVRDGGAGDERLFARAVADRIGATLVEAEWRLADVDVTRCHLPGVPDPVARSFMQGTNSLLTGAASAAGADVTIDGGGGDNVFFGLRSVAPVTDALLHGETLAAGWKTAASVARLAQTSFARVFAKAVRRIDAGEVLARIGRMTIMPAIGYVAKNEDGSFKGQLKTLSIRAEIVIVANRGKSADTQPDYRVLSDGVEIGAGWVRRSETSGRDYVSLGLAAPEFGPRRIYANLGHAPGEPAERFAVIWNPID